MPVESEYLPWSELRFYDTTGIGSGSLRHIILVEASEAMKSVKYGTTRWSHAWRALRWAFFFFSFAPAL
jgi:hypothetical protein